MKSICLRNFKSVAWIIFKLCSGQNSRMKWTKGNNSKINYEALCYGSFALHFSVVRSIYLFSCMLMPCIVLKLCSGQKGTDGRTDWRKDGRVDYYMPPFGVIQTENRKLCHYSRFSHGAVHIHFCSVGMTMEQVLTISTTY